jgi:hypothetical protein
MKRSFYVAGVQFRPRQEINEAVESLKAGDVLSLLPEHSNKFDPNAVKIMQELKGDEEAKTEGVSRFLGYVPKKFSSEVTAFLSLGAPIICTVDEVNPAAKTYEMFKVTVSIPVDEPVEEDDATYEQHLEEEKR